MIGLVTKGIGGFYFVETEDGTFRARGRGHLKRNRAIIMVGDIVEAEPPREGEDDGVINKVYPRRNFIHRPPIANVDILVVTMALRNPMPVLEVTDKLLLMAEKNEIEAVICVNKCDLGEEGEMERLRGIYQGLYPVYFTSCKDDENYRDGIEDLRKAVGDKKVAFAGPSGVGKSSITNLLVPDAKMETGEISTKNYRGKHTTRHVEIFNLGSGYVFDTPGFTSFDLQGIEENELASLFPEFRRCENCRFNDCMHLREPGCRVRSALEAGEIAQSRYDSYISALNTIHNQRF